MLRNWVNSNEKVSERKKFIDAFTHSLARVDTHTIAFNQWVNASALFTGSDLIECEQFSSSLRDICFNERLFIDRVH